MNGLGLPVKLILTGGQAADVTQAPPLLQGLPLKVVIADKAYDSQSVVSAIAAQAAEAVIPSRANAKSPRKTDWSRYKDRNLVERFWAKLKHYRRVATRYEKKAQGSSGVSGRFREEGCDEGFEECFSAFSGVVNELEEPDIERQLFL